MGEIKPDTGTVRWGVTTSHSYLAKDTTKEFNNDQNNHNQSQLINNF